MNLNCVNLDEFTFDDWVKFIFDRTPNEDQNKRWYGNIINEGSQEIFAENCIRLFKSPEFLLESYSSWQLDEGFGEFILTEGIHFWRLWGKNKDADLRHEFILSSVSLFEKLFTKKPLKFSCFMWWDCLRGFNEDKDTKVFDWMFEALSQILDIDSVDCQLSALHGLGHIEHHGKKNLIENFLRKYPNFTHGDYALATIEGNIP